MSINTPPDHPDGQVAYRQPYVISVGTPTAFASVAGSVALPVSHFGLLVQGGTGAGGSIILTAEPSGTQLINAGAGFAVGQLSFSPFAFAPGDSSLQFNVVNGTLWVILVDTLAYVMQNGTAGDLVVQQGPGLAQALGNAWPVVLADPNGGGGTWFGQKGMVDSLPVVVASDQSPLPVAGAGKSLVSPSAGFSLAAGASSTLIAAPGAGLALYLHSLNWVEAVSAQINWWESTDSAQQVATDVPISRGGSNTAYAEQSRDLKGVRLPTNTGLRLRNVNATAGGLIWADVRYSIAA